MNRIKLIKHNLARHLLATAIVILASLFSARFYLHVDLTADKRYSLSEFTRSSLAELDHELKITWYRSDSLTSLTPVVREIGDMLSEFRQASKGKIIFNTDDPTKSDSLMTVRSLGIIPRQLPIDTPEGQVYKDLYSGILFEYGDGFRTIPFIVDTANIEYELLRQILDLAELPTATGSGKSIQVLYAGMGSDYYSYVEPWLSYAGFTIIPAEPGKLSLVSSVPLMVIGSSRLNSADTGAIQAFLDAGGNAAFFVSANTVSVLTDWAAKPKANDPLLALLDSRGFALDRGLLVDIFNYRITMPSVDGSKYENINYPFWITTLPPNTGKGHILFSGIESLQLFWPSRILSGDHTVLASSSPSSVNLTEPYDTNPFGKTLSVFNDSQEKGSGTLVAVSEKGGRIVVVSDEYFPSAMIEYTGSDTNLDFLVNCAEWISGRDGLLALKKGK